MADINKNNMVEDGSLRECFLLFPMVEQIVGERKSGRSLEYLVRWKGYGPKDDSWEPLKNLSGAKQVIKEFHDKTDKLKKSGKKSSRSRSRSQSRSRKSSVSRPRSRSRTRSSSRSRTKSKTVTKLTSTPAAQKATTETVTQSPGRYEKTTETVSRSIEKPGETHKYSSITRTSEVRSSSRVVPEPSKPQCSMMDTYVYTPWNRVKGACCGLVRSDYPALVVFATVSIIMLSFLLEKHVNFEKLWEAIDGFFVGIWQWLTQLVKK